MQVKEGEKLEKTAVIKDLMSERIKEQHELERRMIRLGKNMDHLERARREEEAPFLEVGRIHDDHMKVAYLGVRAYVRLKETGLAIVHRCKRGQFQAVLRC